MTIDTGLISVALALATFLIGRMSSAKNAGVVDGEMKSDIKHIKDTQTELKEDIRLYGENYTEVRAELERLKGRITKLEEIVKIYHKEGL
jgi:peptidoglycan hydrolase CwlO-like protein